MTLDVRGKTVVLTGTFAKLKRAAAEAQLVELGAKIGSGVNKTTHVLFAGEKAGSKIDAAGRLGITVLGETELMAVLAGGASAGGASAGKPGSKAKQASKAGASAAPVAAGFELAGLDAGQAGELLAAAIEGLAWALFDAERDLFGLRELLYAHEKVHGVTAAHRAATARVRPQALLRHAHGHDVEVEWTDLSPDGRYLATGSWVGEDYHRGGVLQIWDVRAGRCVNMLRIGGGVGWPDETGCIQWRPDGRRVGLAYDTNGVGSFDPFGKTGEPDSCAYVTDGWDHPPAWTWAPNSRDVYIACWGPNLALGAIVPLIGRRPQPRWCASVKRGDSASEPRLGPLGGAKWALPERIVGSSDGRLVAIDPATGDIVWEQAAAPPISFSPDGEEFAMHPAGIVYYATRTGLPTGKLPMHVGAESLVWSRDGQRLAAVVQPGNRWGAEPGVFIYDRGDYRYSPDAPAPGEGEQYSVAWRPDGRKLAVTVGQRLQIWALGEAPTLGLDIVSPAATGVAYGEGVLVAWSSFGLGFYREDDGAAIGVFKPAIEASGESPLADEDGEPAGAGFGPGFPLDATRVAAALPEGLVIGPDQTSASVAEVDRLIAWVIDRRWAWPWRWGEAKIWPDAASACADPAAPASLKKRFGKRSKAPVRAAKVEWPPEGGSLDDIAELLKAGIAGIGDGYHSNDYRRNYAARTMALGMFERAAAALDGEAGWSAWSDPWFSAYAHGETVLTALTGRIAGSPALTREQTAQLKGWLVAGEALLKKKEAKLRAACRPLAVIGASWIALGEAARGEKLLATAIATIDPEDNTTEHRRVVAQALAAVGRVREAIDHLASGTEKPSWTETPIAFAAIARRASAAELEHLFVRMKKVDAHEEHVLLDRGLARLIELKAWDAAVAWIEGFDRLATGEATQRLVTAMAAAGEVARAEAALAARLKPTQRECGQMLLVLARFAPALARARLGPIVAGVPKLLVKVERPGPLLGALAGAAARVGELAMAERVEALARDVSERFAVRLGVLAELAPDDPAWPRWFSRARAELPREEHAGVRLAALAYRGGQLEAREELIDLAIAAARAAGSADLTLEEVAGRLAREGDLAGGHRAWLAISKGRRPSRNRPLLDVCAAQERWAALLDLLRQMPMDLNGAPKRASQVLLKAGGGEGW